MPDDTTDTDGPETVKAYPSKDTYDAVGADVDAPTAAGELTDNAIDNAALISNHADPITVEFDYHTLDDGTEELVVRDNSGGIQPEELGVVIGLGRSKKEQTSGQQVGAFGIGAKKALKALGDEFTIASRYYRNDQGYQYHVPAAWFEDDEAWEFDLEEVDLEEGVTELRIRDLNIDWENQVERIKEWLRDTYQLYLGVGPSGVKLDLTLKVDGEVLEPPEPIPWAYSPWDGLHPRQHHGFTFDSRELNAPVKMQVTVGVMRSGDGTEAGTDIFCQDRLVEKANREQAGAYGAPDGLPKFELHMYRRMKIQVEFWTTEGGTAKDLPWNSDKSRINPNHPVMMQAYEWIRKVARRYMKAAQYGASGVDEAFLKHYDEDSEHSVELERVDFSSRWERHQNGQEVRVTDKPKNGFPQVGKMEQTAEAHAKLGVVCKNVGWFEDWMLPAYEDLLNERFDELSDDGFDGVVDLEGLDVSLDSLRNVTAAPPDFTSGNRQVEAEVERLAGMAMEHARNGYRYTGLDEWERPWYEATQSAIFESDDWDIERSDLTETSDFPETEPKDDEAEQDETPDDTDGVSDETGASAGTQTELASDDGDGPTTVDRPTGNGVTTTSADTDSESDTDSQTTSQAGGPTEGDARDFVFANWTDEELELVSEVLADVEELDDEERKEMLVNLAEDIREGRLQYNVISD